MGVPWAHSIISWLFKPTVMCSSVMGDIIASCGTVALRPNVLITGDQSSTPNKASLCVVNALTVLPTPRINTVPVANTLKTYTVINTLSLPQSQTKRLSVNPQWSSYQQPRCQSLTLALRVGYKRHTLYPRQWQFHNPVINQSVSRSCYFTAKRHSHWQVIAGLAITLRHTSIKCLSHAEHAYYARVLARQAGCPLGRVILRRLYQGIAIGAFEKLESCITHVIHHREDCLLATPKIATDRELYNDTKNNYLTSMDVIIGLRLDNKTSIKAIIPSKFTA
jgi:hypothetical protein